ncbi:MAG: ArsR/SmtB family transcription factor [Acidimicrobiales bacterium]
MFDDTTEPDEDELDLPTVLAALADPGRLATVRTLARTGESWCSQLQADSGLDCTKSTMSHHLKVLRESGVTHTRVAGAHRYVSLRRDAMEHRFPGLLEAVCGPRVDISTPSA